MEAIPDVAGAAGLRAWVVRLVAMVLYVSGALGFLRWCARYLKPALDSRQRATFPFVKSRHARNLQILTYHRVNDEHDPYFPATPIRVFEAQMAYVAKHCHVCELGEAVEGFRKGDLPPNAIVVTFDDGYRDNYLHAFPVVQKLSIPMTIFLATDVIGTGQVLWHDRVFAAFRETQERAVRGYHPSMDGCPLSSVPERIGTMEKVLKLLRQLDESSRYHQISRLCQSLGVNEKVADHSLMLSWEDVRLMGQQRVGFGSHTASHPILSQLSEGEVASQLARSGAAFERHLGQRPITFAYPNGTKADFNDVTKLVLRQHGFTCAVTTEFGVNEPGQDLFELKRGRPWEEHLPTFAFKLSWYRLMSSQAA